MSTLLAAVAVPLPLPDPLTYEVPPAFAELARPGVRVRVRVGRRKLVGVITARPSDPPAGVELRPLEAVLDREPVLSPELLELAQATADYYLAPIGEVLRSMLPGDLPPWGDRRVWLSDAGAVTAPRDRDEAAVLGVLRDRGRMRTSDLLRAVGIARLPELLERLRSEGRVVLSEGDRRGVRYPTAVELGAGEHRELLERCGRSPAGREVVGLLAALGRPATLEEVCQSVGCTPAVVRRLVSKNVLRKFTQVAKIPLDHHLVRLPAGEIPKLRSDQQEAVSELLEAVEHRRYAAYLLAGITGSGKTEVYLRAIDKVLKDNGSAIVMVPEIALVPMLAGSARQRFGEQVAIVHSGLTSSERHQEWGRIQRGEARLVLGPRSAVFAPVSNLRLVVVDEEQDSSYKQDQTPRYHGRDLAVLRAHQTKATVLLVSATPSLETRHNVEVGKMRQLRLRHRVGQGELPTGILVDLRQESPHRRPGEIHFSDRLQAEISQSLACGDQVILLRNRRGYAPLLLCRACGDDSRCEDCGLPRTLHLRDRRLRCHYCGSATTVPDICASCSEDALEAIGAGTERVEEELRLLFPEAAVGVLDRDAARRGAAAAVLERFVHGETHILVGTQMVSKGHHFPRVALTAVLLADTYLGFPDFRAVEKTYSLLTQLAGRAGRGERPGRVLIQTYHPEHYAVQAALTHDDYRFAAEEMRFRRIFHYPPYTRMIQLLLRDTNKSRAEKTIEKLANQLSDHPLAKGVRIAGPAPAPFEKLRGKWRFQLLLRGPNGKQLRQLIAQALPRVSSDLVIDVDPYELL